MRLLIAKGFRQAFKISFFKSRFFGIHQRIFKPYHLFKGKRDTVDFNGFILDLKIDDWIQEKIYFLGEYEKAELKAMSHFLKPGDTFLDLGANIGVYSLHASRIVGPNGKVISFEPFSTNFEALKKHVEINSLTNVQLENMAVGNEEGTLTLYLDENEDNLGMVTANYTENAVQEKVRIVSIDQYVEENAITNVDFAKIDIEGYEYPTLMGMLKTLQKYHPTILIEVLEDSNTSKNNENVFSFLADLGYQKHFISDEGELCDFPTNIERKNYLFSIS